MKLDRNINPDGRGKYALINLRLAPTFDPNNPESVEVNGEKFALVPLKAIQTGRDGQFFVMKYADQFTPSGLQGYADGIHSYLMTTSTTPEEHDRLEEYLFEIVREAGNAAEQANKLPD